MKNNPWRIIIAVMLAGIVADFIHIHVGIGVPVYSPFIEWMSYLTKPEEAVGCAIVYYLLGDRLPTSSRVIHGLLLGAILLMVQGQLFRQLFMNLLLPNTWKEALQFQSQAWLSKIIMSLIITWLINPKYKKF